MKKNKIIQSGVDEDGFLWLIMEPYNNWKRITVRYVELKRELLGPYDEAGKSIGKPRDVIGKGLLTGAYYFTLQDDADAVWDLLVERYENNKGVDNECS